MTTYEQPPPWSFWRFLRESRKYMAHKPAWWVYPRAVLKWPRFHRQSQRDYREIVASNARQLPS